MGEMEGEGELMLARFSEWVLSAPLKDYRLAAALLCLAAGASERPMDLRSPLLTPVLTSSAP